MNSKHYIGRRVGRFERSGDIRAVDGVALIVDEEHEFRAGDMEGNVLEITCPYGTQAMADALLTQLRGRTYTGYTAENAAADPAAELGDGVTVGGIYSLLASREVSFGSGHLSRIGAPAESDMDHEYAAADPYTREIERKLAGARSYIDKKSDEILLGVEGMEGDVAELKVSVGSISGTVTGLNGDVSTLKQTATSLTGRIQSAEGDITDLEATARGLSSSVSGLDGRVSKIEQSAERITLSVTGSLGGKASISLSNGSSGTIDLSDVRTAFANDRTNVTIQGGTLTFNGGGIAFNSGSTFTVNSTNLTVTSGGLITAFDANLNQCHLGRRDVGSNQFPAPAAFCDGNVFLQKMSSTSSWSLYGTATGTDLCIATVSTQSQFFSGSQCIVIGWNDNIFLYCGTDNEVRANKSVHSTSDRDQKRDIEDIDERYLAIMDNISPVRFKYVGQSEPAAFALGYIAQDVEAALGKAGLTRADFAGLSGEDGTGCMALSYDDFIPLLHLKLRALEARIDRLEGRI